MVNVNDLAIFYLFSTFSMEQLEKISEITDKKAYKKHDHVYERGDRANQLFVVNKGLISLKRFDHEDNVGVTFETPKSGELFGAASFMHPRHYTLTAVCMEDSEVLAIDADKLSDLCQKHPAVGHKLMLKIAQVYFERYMKTNS
jgi:CRP/FNR family transcriptional regulator, cyclic AMP receptor protein